ncbi:MAG TPA: hypothetical protein PLG77_13735, partial [Burkholderiaceae bacterium]|nr:hypothetical protein [Burkholderiaceae bacterium]
MQFGNPARQDAHAPGHPRHPRRRRDGLGGAGQLHYPTLADDAWIWGGSFDAIQDTIRHGIRNEDDPDARFGMMPAFGADDILGRDEIAAVVQYVLALGGRDHHAALAAA